MEITSPCWSQKAFQVNANVLILKVHSGMLCTKFQWMYFATDMFTEWRRTRTVWSVAKLTAFMLKSNTSSIVWVRYGTFCL